MVTRAKIQSLESLRGLAAMAVVLSHLQLAFWCGVASTASPPFTSLWHNGDFAVRLFFVLSGFVLSRSYFITRSTSVVTSAAIRRYFRLAAPASASILLSYILCITGAMRNHALADRLPEGPNQWLHSFYMVTPTVTTALREALFGAYFDFLYTPSLNVVLWTLEVEMRGSFLIFAVMALSAPVRNRCPVYAILMFILDSIGARFMVDFVAGMATCDFYTNSPPNRHMEIAAPFLFLAGLGLGDLRGEWLESIGASTLNRGNRFWPTVASVCVVLGAIYSTRICRILSIRPLLALGSVSFCLYVFHLPILCSAAAIVYCKLRNASVGHSTSAYAASAVCVASSLAAATIGALTIEPRALRLGRWVETTLLTVKPGQLPPTRPDQIDPSSTSRRTSQSSTNIT